MSTAGESSVALLLSNEPERTKCLAMLVMAGLCECVSAVDQETRADYKGLLVQLGVLLTLTTGLRAQDVDDIMQANRADCGWSKQ